MKCLLYAVLMLLSGWSACAQTPAASTGVTIILKDGKSIAASSLRRSGDNLMAKVQVGNGMGEIGYPVGNVARVTFPEPSELKIAASLLTQNKPSEALTQLAPVIAYYNPFRDVPGSWWSQAALLKLQALLALGRDKETEQLIGELASVSSDPESARMAKVQQAAAWTRKGEHDKALPVYDAVIKESKDHAVLSQAWLNKGHSLLAQKEYEPALLAYLHVPVFYPEQNLLVPAAMLGSGRALIGLDDRAEAETRLEELITRYPNSAEAAAAKTEIDKLKKKS